MVLFCCCSDTSVYIGHYGREACFSSGGGGSCVFHLLESCSGLHDGGIGACYICWLVELMPVVLMLPVLVNLLKCYRYGSESYTCFACSP